MSLALKLFTYRTGRIYFWVEVEMASIFLSRTRTEVFVDMIGILWNVKIQKKKRIRTFQLSSVIFSPLFSCCQEFFTRTGHHFFYFCLHCQLRRYIELPVKNSKRQIRAYADFRITLKLFLNASSVEVSIVEKTNEIINLSVNKLLSFYTIAEAAVTLNNF